MKARLHWNKFKKMWTVHTYKSCTQYPYILIDGDWYTELKPEKKTNPKGFVVTTDDKVHILEENNVYSILKQYPNKKQLWYDKENISFNVSNGNKLLFTPKGVYIFD